MCSSPKSSGPAGVNKKPIKPFGHGLTKEQRLRFADVANRADERRQKKREEKRRWEKKHQFDNSKKQRTSVLQWFNNVLASL